MTEFLSAIAGAIVGGVLTMFASIKAVRESTKDLELIEIRKQKVECLANLLGLRFVTVNPLQYDEYRSKLMFELNRIAILWSDDGCVLKDLRDYHADPNEERLVKLFRTMGRTTKFPVENLSDADIRHIFIVGPSQVQGAHRAAPL